MISQSAFRTSRERVARHKNTSDADLFNLCFDGNYSVAEGVRRNPNPNATVMYDKAQKLRTAAAESSDINELNKLFDDYNNMSNLMYLLSKNKNIDVNISMKLLKLKDENINIEIIRNTNISVEMVLELLKDEKNYLKLFDNILFSGVNDFSNEVMSALVNDTRFSSFAVNRCDADAISLIPHKYLKEKQKLLKDFMFEKQVTPYSPERDKYMDWPDVPITPNPSGVRRLFEESKPSGHKLYLMLLKRQELQYKTDELYSRYSGAAQWNYGKTPNDSDLPILQYNLIQINKKIIDYILYIIKDWKSRRVKTNRGEEWEINTKIIQTLTNVSKYSPSRITKNESNSEKMRRWRKIINTQRIPIEVALNAMHTGGPMIQHLGLDKFKLDYLSNIDTSVWDKQLERMSSQNLNNIKLSKRQEKLDDDDLRPDPRYQQIIPKKNKKVVPKEKTTPFEKWQNNKKTKPNVEKREHEKGEKPPTLEEIQDMIDAKYLRKKYSPDTSGPSRQEFLEEVEGRDDVGNAPPFGQEEIDWNGQLESERGWENFGLEGFRGGNFSTMKQVYRPFNLINQEMKEPLEGQITDGGFVSPDGKYYVLEGHIRHAEWILEHYQWLKKQGFDLGLDDEKNNFAGRHDVRAALIQKGWIRIRIEAGGVTVTCLNPKQQSSIIDQFFKDHAVDLKEYDLKIEDIDYKTDEEMVTKLQGPLEKIDIVDILKRLLIKFHVNNIDEKDGLVRGQTTLYDPENNDDIIGYVHWKLSNNECDMDIAEVRKKYNKRRVFIEDVLDEATERHFAKQNIKIKANQGYWGNTAWV